jgi:CRISPR-associated protein Cas1
VIGYGSALKVKHGELVVFDEGVTCSYPKVTHGLKNIMFMGSGGSITIDAIKWCDAQDVSICVVGYHGELVSMSLPPSVANVQLRRMQYAADKIDVSRAILTQKFIACVRIGKINRDVADNAISLLECALTIEDMTIIEAKIATEYWRNWNFRLKFKSVAWPVAWSEFSQRASEITGKPRHANHPVNAILNYAYAVVSAQLTRALHAAMLDTAAGFLHADRPLRHSLTYDAIELLRPEVDARVLAWVKTQVWTRADFPTTPKGVVRLQPTLAKVVAKRAAVPHDDIVRVVNWVVMIIRGK